MATDRLLDLNVEVLDSGTGVFTVIVLGHNLPDTMAVETSRWALCVAVGMDIDSLDNGSWDVSDPEEYDDEGRRGWCTVFSTDSDF